MNQKTAEKIISVQEELQDRADYKELLAEYRRSDERLLTLLKELDEQQAKVIWDFLGVGIELHLMMLAQAIEME